MDYMDCMDYMDGLDGYVLFSNEALLIVYMKVIIKFNT